MRKDFWIMVFEAFFGEFYFIITRSLTPIFLVNIGYSLGDLLLLNAFAGLLSLLIAPGFKEYKVFWNRYTHSITHSPMYWREYFGALYHSLHQINY